jgi:hypothetical protein
MGRALFAAGLSLVLAGLGHFFLGLKRGFFFVLPSAVLLYVYVFRAELFDKELTMAVFLSLGIFAAFDAFSFAKRGHGIV